MKPNSLMRGAQKGIALVLGLLFSVALLSAGCGGSSKVASDPSVAGVYNLVTVDGQKLPATISHSGAQLEIRSGAMTINADGTCSSRMVFVPPSGREVTKDVIASYKQSGPNLTMRWERAGMTIGRVEDNTFTMNNEGMVLSYQR
jgi:hypothetical protein